jgi:hypothetical protein
MRSLDLAGARWGRRLRVGGAGRAVSLCCQTATVSPGVVAEQFAPLREISSPLCTRRCAADCLAGGVRLATCVPGTARRSETGGRGWLGRVSRCYESGYSGCETKQALSRHKVLTDAITTVQAGSARRMQARFAGRCEGGCVQ